MASSEARVIRELPKSMINKIAAGEVVERPASAVKELVENAADAGATRVDVETEKSGVEFIKVTDDGCGIPADQVLLALSPHATSKIAKPEDLFHISTLGFRGEALASIAEISHLTLTTRAEGAAEGARVRCDGAEKGPVEAVGRNVGTTIEIRDLFFNVPVRRKFLKSPVAEYGQIKEAIVRLAIPHPEIAFTLRHNGSLDIDLPPSRDMFDRIRALFGDRVASRLTPVERRVMRNGVVVSGFVGRPDLWRGSGAMQYLFVNGRFFRDKALFSALKAAYQGLLKQGMFPVVFLNLETPLDFVDVNVHPTKQEVRFVDGQAMYAAILHSVRDKLLESNLERRPDAETIAASADVPIRRADPEKNEAAPVDATPASSADDEPREIRFVPDVDPLNPRLALDESAVGNRVGWLDELAARRRAQNNGAPREEDSEPRDVAASPSPTRERDAARLTRILQGRTPEFRKFPDLNGSSPDRRRGLEPTERPERDEEKKFAPGSFGGRALPTEKKEERPSDKPSAPETLVPSPEEPLRALSFEERRARVKENNERLDLSKNRLIALTSDRRPVVQLCDRYLVMEVPDGIALVDQHALHERILYEKIKAGYEKAEVRIQRLLVPEAVDLSPLEFAFVVERKELFAGIGLLVEPLGGSTVVVNGYPAIFSATPPTEIFCAALGAIYEKRAKTANVADLIEGALRQMACKAAIKAGDRLSPDDVAELVALAETEILAHHCPHGRPSVVVFTTDKIDQFFIRD